LQPDYALAFADIKDGLIAYPIWTRLGWQEVKRRYRRTVFGPFWTTLSLAIFIFAVSFVYAPIFKVELRTYLPYLTTGLISWAITAALINEGCGTFTANEGLIKQLNFPFSTFAFVIVWRNIVVFIHHLAILAAVYLWLPQYFTFKILLAIPGLLILSANGAWMAMLLGMVSARFRDIPPLVGNLVQVLLFVTPIFWTATQLGPQGKYFVYPNYVYHLVTLVRAPLFGETPDLFTYVITIVGACIGWAVTFAIYARFRRRIAFWL
jgi:lipopolysaccharide transport system permease protein